MAATVSVTVTGTLLDGAGAAITSANVKAQRVDPNTLLATTLATADSTSTTSNSSTGIFSLTLTGYDLTPVTYKITMPDGQYLYLRLPPNAKYVGLGPILCGVTPAKSVRDITPQFAHVRIVGQDIASATTITPTCDVHTVTGTTAITTVTASTYPAGKMLTLIFASTPTFTDGSNLKLAGNLVATADDTITIFTPDQTNFYEVARSVN